MSQLAEERDGLQPAERLLNELAFTMTEPVTHVSCRPTVDRTAHRTRTRSGHVRRDAHPTDGRHPCADVVGLVRGDGDTTRRQRQLAEQRDRRVKFGRPARVGDRGVNDEPVAVLGQEMTEIAQLGFTATRFLGQPRVRIGGRLMRVVPARLAVESDRRILRIIGRACVACPSV